LLIFSERAWLIRGSAGSSLTDAERRIAELAAQGLSNRQVAGRVFLSADTVAFSPAARLLEARRQLAGAARAHGGRAGRATLTADRPDGRWQRRRDRG
jgi:FixJ family two-component response regulator